MTARTTLLTAGTLVCTGLASWTYAQPRLVITGTGSDLAASGNGVAGLAYDGAAEEYVPFVWSRGPGYTQINGAYFSGGGMISCSADLGALAMATDNVLNWESLNCFNGYDANGNLVPPDAEPCAPVAISHHWTAATGWVNTGSFNRFTDPVTGRLIGGTVCDFDINLPKDISGDGRYLLANGWYARATALNGGPSAGFCGNFYPFRYDSQTGTVEQLPVQPGSGTARADYMNFDGSVMTGYDLGPVDVGGTLQDVRRTCVWKDGVQTLLDAHLGAKDNAAVNGPGTVVATGASTEFVAETFPGQMGVRLVRWNWSGSAWVPENLGRPVAYFDPQIGIPISFSNLWATGISDDGNTIVGVALYGAPPPTIGGIFRPFIWSPSINGGVPIDLEAHLATLGAPIFTDGLAITSVQGISGDGNALLVELRDARNTCELNQSHLVFNIGILYLDGAQVPCDPPRIGMSPRDWAEAHDYPFGSAFNVLASGSWPLSYQWQREDPNQPGVWVDLSESCSGFDESDWAYEGVYKSQLRVGQHFAGGDRAGNYRVIVSNACGSVVSEPATLTHLVGACCIEGVTCYIEYAGACGDVGGTWMGAGQTCDSQPCQFAPCCMPNGDCAQMVTSACTAAGGLASNVGEHCFFIQCDVCPADFDGNQAVEVPDIFAFLTAWFAGEPAAYEFGGTPGVPAIFAFLTAWFAGCP